ncbi:TRAP transporter large permease [Moorella sulfitireducens]|uniref:TRAP transporter large permease n=1 Tax=Neomoorella sulfitireducens TaxID=2972948 RepID=UPI0021AC2518|nr:TRAP transporter large permease [Moorella sulfitireducens]
MTTGAIILLTVFFSTLFLNVPIAICLGLSSVVALLLTSDIPHMVIMQSMFGNTNNFTLMAVPFFILAGNLMQNGGVSKRLINFCKIIVGGFPGGLGHVAILASMIFAAISGSGPATVAALGLITIPNMAQAGYDKSYACALQAAAGGIGVIIPPSIPMVVYAALASTSVAAMFAGGIIPGIIIGILLMTVNYYLSKKRGYGGEVIERSPKIIWNSFKEAFWALLMPVIILGGIYSGVFTPTEAAGVAVIYGFIVGAFIYKELDLRGIKKMLIDSAIMTSVCMIIMAMAAPFAWVITSEQVAVKIADFFSTFTSKYIFLLTVNLIFLLIGCFMSSLAALIIVTPLFLPILQTLDINLIHFGVMMVINLELGMMTPPFGVNLFVACGIGRITIEQIALKVLPFVIATIIGLFMIAYIPQLITFLPSLLGLM